MNNFLKNNDRQSLNIRIEHSKNHPNEYWVFDRVHGFEHCKIVDGDDLSDYISRLVVYAHDYGDYSMMSEDEKYLAGLLQAS